MKTVLKFLFASDLAGLSLSLLFTNGLCKKKKVNDGVNPKRIACNLSLWPDSFSHAFLKYIIVIKE